VWNPGLLPCLAPDVFQGITWYDMMLFTKYFVQLGWFSLNDWLSKPTEINSLSRKALLGNASQLSVF